MKKVALFTDIHWGRMNNSETHNKDCMDFVKWFCNNVKADKDIDSVIFLGDWHEHRSAINGLTLKYSYEGMKTLNDLGIPVYVIIGNHDLHNRNNREVFTTNPFESLSNIKLINESTAINNDILIVPFLFPEEYPDLIKSNAKWVFGHFEFKGFVVTGEYRVMDHGPEHSDFRKFKRIFSGHFHRRQIKDNVCYIGNAFPADFGDANDVDRGMAIYEFSTDTLIFKNWDECPKYIKCNLSDIVAEPSKFLKKNARVRAIVDIELSLEESSTLRESLVNKFKLRELNLEEQYTFSEKQGENDFDLSQYENETTSNIIKEMLRQMKSDSIDNQRLLKIYEAI